MAQWALKAAWVCGPSPDTWVRGPGAFQTRLLWAAATLDSTLKWAGIVLDGSEGMPSPQAGCRASCAFELAFTGEGHGSEFSPEWAWFPKEDWMGDWGVVEPSQPPALIPLYSWRNFPMEVEGYKVSGGINGQDTSELQTPKIMWDLMPSNYCRWTQLEESEAHPHPHFCNSNAPSALQ